MNQDIQTNAPQKTELRWGFRPLARGEVNSDPTNAEFFTTNSLTDALIREVIQNSLDARSGDAAVQMRILLPERRSLRPDLAFWLGNIWPHLHADGSGLRAPPTEFDELDFLVIEDFGTRGLCGDFEQAHDRSGVNEPKNDFFYFWRNVGRSIKQESDRGRWGLGKTVLPAASRIQSFFGLTLRSSDYRRLLFGQSILKTHQLDGINYSPFGYFGHVHEDAFALPLQDDGIIEKFTREFQLARGNAPGLSLVVPFPALNEITSEALLQSCVAHYFYPILSGDLVLVLEAGGSTRILARNTIRNAIDDATFAEEADKLRLLKLVDMSARAQSITADELISIPPMGDKGPYRWRERLFPEGQSAQLRGRFDAGEVLGFRVPMQVKKKEGNIEASYFDAFVMKDAELGKAEDHYIRQGITITGARGLKSAGIRGLLVADDRPLCALLGDAEGPAHTEWNERSQHFKEKYEDGVSVLRFVKNSLQSIAAFLSATEEGIDVNLLGSLFSIELPVYEQDTPAGGARDTRGDKPFLPAAIDVQRSGEKFMLSRTPNGLRVSADPNSGSQPERLVIEAAYEVRRGDPFRKYSPFDFEFGSPAFEVLTKRARIVSAARNRIEINIEEADFTVRVEGFDQRRDVRVRVMES